LNRDANANKDQRRKDRTLRFNLFVNWRPTGRQVLTASFSNTAGNSRGDLSLTSEQRNTQLEMQWSWRFLGKPPAEHEAGALPRLRIQGQLFARYSHRYARSRNELFKLNNYNRGDTFHTGLSFTFF
jgi:hypothetical protein